MCVRDSGGDEFANARASVETGFGRYVVRRVYVHWVHNYSRIIYEVSETVSTQFPN